MEKEITREQLHAYLEDALSDAEMSGIEKLLRDSEQLRFRLKQVREEQDRGEHSLGAIWRRERLSCPSREQLSGFLHGILEPDVHGYIDFHLKTIGCASCLANLDDIKEKQAESEPQKKRRRKIFQSSAGLLKAN
ncbi:hypothetical protein KIH39_01320 [Telmatocola sphagniphila]|uniref:Uncharacterized protein n=1 Tax=Telmatocola sphagniphila TaxID=1123043 RepID=A0A8E6BB58_9BACT|nr:hypothetical protein KIH39_01320 [Telmatocola sphagniphila]